MSRIVYFWIFVILYGARGRINIYAYSHLKYAFIFLIFTLLRFNSVKNIIVFFVK